MASEGYAAGTRWLHLTVPFGLSQVTQLPLISVTTRDPSLAGKAPFGSEYWGGGWCRRPCPPSTPSTPPLRPLRWRRRQLLMSASHTVPSGAGTASSGLLHRLRLLPRRR